MAGVTVNEQPSRRYKELIMKKQASKLIALASLFLALTAVSAQAQSRGTIEVQIPFDFIAGETRLPAGTYNIKRISRGDEKALLVRSQDNRVTALVSTNSVEASAERSQARLVFHRYGEQYFLSQVWNAGSLAGRELPASKAEREVMKAQKLAKNEAKPLLVEINAHAK
jgi:hypothetical protein